MAPRPRSPARLLAPLALVVCALAFFAVLTSSGTGDGSDGDGGSEPAQSPATPTTDAQAEPGGEPRQRATYRVKVGDTLDGIAETTGVDVETLLEINPELDPQALEPEQRIKLRE